MCLVRAVEARLSPPERRQAMVDRAMVEGFILTAHFYESLPAYEKDDRSMRFYAVDLIGSIDLEKEDKRIGQLTFAESRQARRVKPVERPKPPEQTGVNKDLATADGLYEKRDLAAAKPAYRKIIETPASKPAHAQAYYGLARIALLEKNPELAEKLFEKILELEPEPAVKAWAYVYLARLAMATQEPDYGRAVEQYKAALGVEGASDMARASAQKELQAANDRLKK
jgi:tetratricopeptide (TPR) repeat protein